MHLIRHHKNQSTHSKQAHQQNGQQPHAHQHQTSQHYVETQQQVTPAPFNWNLTFLPKEVRELAAKRKALHDKTAMIECRLRFGYSVPLADYKMQLVKEDIEISCKITEYLLSLPKQS